MSRFRAYIVIVTLLAALSISRRAPAQALWDLSLDAPDQTVTQGSSGTIVFTGSIQDTDASLNLNLNGDSFSTGNWDPSLTLGEDPSFTNFLLNIGQLPPGASYAGGLFDLTYTSLTPAATSPPYDGMFLVDTDGTPNLLSAPFTLTVFGQSSAGTPEPAPFVLLSGAAAAWLMWRNRSRAHT